MPWLMPQAVDSGITRCDLMSGTLCRGVVDVGAVLSGTSGVVNPPVGRQGVFIRHVLEVLEYMHAPAHAYLK